MAVQEYKCPCCGGAISFDSNIQKMKCPYCDTEFEMETLREYDEALAQDAEDNMQWDQTSAPWEETGNVRQYVCTSCGGTIIGDGSLAATSCPYCDNPVVMTEQLAGMLKPDYVLPFKLDKMAAKAGMAKYLQGKPLLPKAFKTEQHIDEIKGIYVPFWLFNTGVQGDFRYRATRVHTYSDSKYVYTETSYFSVLRGGEIAFQNVPVDGSQKMPDDLMEALEPYDFSEAVDFQTAYLAGYFADRYDVDSQTSIKRANERVKNCTQQAFNSTVLGYTSFFPEHSSVRLSGGKTKYALYPVWILNTTWKGKKYLFAMNGQTGKFVGNLPIDKKKYCLWLFGLGGIIASAMYLLSFAFGLV